MQAKVIVGKSHPSHAIGTPPRKGSKMKTFARHMASLTQIRHSFCSSMFMTTTIVLVFVTIGLPQVASGQTCPKLPATITQCPCRIESPGQYSLSQDLMNCDSGGIAIIVVPPAVDLKDVYLNLNGYTISGQGVAGSVGIVMNGSNVHIVGGLDVSGKAGTVKGFAVGIQAGGGENNHLSDLTLRENGTGLALSNANNYHVSGCTISDSGGEGIALSQANHNVIDSNTINHNGLSSGAGGLILRQSDDNTISSNNFSNNSNFGVSVGESKEAEASKHNTIRGNIINGVPPVAGVFSTEIGIDVGPGSNNNTIQDNTLFENETGISLLLGRRNTFVYGNTALLNRTDLSDQNADCDDNTWTHNKFLTSAPACIQ